MPIKVEVGPRDVSANKVMAARRDLDPKDKSSMEFDEFVAGIASMLADVQQALYERALERRKNNTITVDDTEAFKKHFSQQAGFVEAYWHEKAIDHPVLKELSVTPRCIPLGQDHPPGKCVLSGEPTRIKVLFAKSY